MRAVLISPYSRGPARGNITTVNRICRHLQQAGVQILALPLDAVAPGELESRALQFRPDVVHAFHIRYCGQIAADLAERLKRPLVITTTGSDIYDEALLGQSATAGALARTQAIVCFSAAEAERVSIHFPACAGLCVTIPQGVDWQEDFAVGPCTAEKPFVLLPAALRPVKNIECAIRATGGLTVDGLPLRLLIAGGAIDSEYAGRIRDLINCSPWVRWLGEVPFEQMGILYRNAEVVLNCSLYESMPNSLMEAMACGRAVLAADIPGNRCLVFPGQTGWLYDATEDDLRAKLTALLGDRALRANCGWQAQRHIREKHCPVREAQAYLELYRSLA